MEMTRRIATRLIGLALAGVPLTGCSYNERVQEYNTATQQFPANLTAKVFGFREHPFFQAPPEAQQVPKVNFN